MIKKLPIIDINKSIGDWDIWRKRLGFNESLKQSFLVTYDIYLNIWTQGTTKTVSGWTTKKIKKHNGLIKKGAILKVCGRTPNNVYVQLCESGTNHVAEFSEDEIKKFILDGVFVEVIRNET